MTCFQKAKTHFPFSYSPERGASLGGYATEAECNQACQEGACCEGTTCTVKPQCQCQGAGKTFKGVGTTCAGSPCGCCCISGAVDTTKNEQQCLAAGGTWKAYKCDKLPPSQIPLALSLNDYTTNGQGFLYISNGDRLNFSCARGNHLLDCCTNGVASVPGYSKTITNGIVVAFNVTTSGTWQYPNASVSACGCNVAKIAFGTIYYHQATLAEPPAPQVYGNQNPVRSCAPPFYIAPGLWPRFSLRPDGSNSANGWEVEIPQFCSGVFSISGSVVAPDGVTCGTFTLGNPLP